MYWKRSFGMRTGWWKCSWWLRKKYSEWRWTGEYGDGVVEGEGGSYNSYKSWDLLCSVNLCCVHTLVNLWNTR